MARHSTKMVLVVEDDAALRRDLCGFLEEAGFPAIGASSLIDAIRYLSSGAPAPSLIVLDLDLGVSPRDGWEFKSWLEGEPGLSDVPVVVASAHNNNERLGRGIVAFVRKPYAPEAILEKVRTYC